MGKIVFRGRGRKKPDLARSIQVGQLLKLLNASALTKCSLEFRLGCEFSEIREILVDLYILGLIDYDKPSETFLPAGAEQLRAEINQFGEGGASLAEIAAHCGVSVEQLKPWLDRFQQMGIVRVANEKYYVVDLRPVPLEDNSPLKEFERLFMQKTEETN